MATNGEILRLVIEYGIPTASAALNVFNFLIEAGAASDEGTLEDMVDWTANVWGPDWQDLAQDVASIIGISVDVVNIAGEVVRNLGSNGITLPGLVGGEAGVAAAAGYIKADTEFPKTRGSKYIPGLGEGNLLDGLLTTESVADLVLLLADFVTPFIGSANDTDYMPGVVSRTLLQFVEFSGAGSTTDVPSYQRRRKPNVGS